ncbi:hypothetical protein NDU88_005107 [Pleurodeles waltl]|uniref:Uncharacterized protein n=1 Tax=Pleurodeles waltl TaxID=8319 RepID=A0AAV7VMK6_PLEWA|nr:hypothetical protein NDU88_005107 [Pleurodeles waltl]
MIPGMSICGVAHPPGRCEEPAGRNRAASGHRPQRRVGAAPPEQGLRMKAAAQLRACFTETRLTAGRAQVHERDTSTSRAQASSRAAPGYSTEWRRHEVGRLARRVVRSRSGRSTQLCNRRSSRFDAAYSVGVSLTGEGGIRPCGGHMRSI